MRLEWVWIGWSFVSLIPSFYCWWWKRRATGVRRLHNSQNMLHIFVRFCAYWLASPSLPSSSLSTTLPPSLSLSLSCCAVKLIDRKCDATVSTQQNSSVVTATCRQSLLNKHFIIVILFRFCPLITNKQQHLFLQFNILSPLTLVEISILSFTNPDKISSFSKILNDDLHIKLASDGNRIEAKRSKATFRP